MSDSFTLDMSVFSFNKREMELHNKAIRKAALEEAAQPMREARDKIFYHMTRNADGKDDRKVLGEVKELLTDSLRALKDKEEQLMQAIDKELQNEA